MHRRFHIEHILIYRSIDLDVSSGLFKTDGYMVNVCCKFQRFIFGARVSKKWGRPPLNLRSIKFSAPYRVRQTKRESCWFQDCETIIASTETNITSAERSGSKLFGARRTRAWQYYGGVTTIFSKRTFLPPRAPMLFAARGRGALLIMPRPQNCHLQKA